MKKLLIAVFALTMVAMTSNAHAQKGAIRLGGGLLHAPGINFIGGGAGVDIGLGDKPFALSIDGGYYVKSGVKFIPITAVAMFRKAMPNGKLGVFFGAGGGYSIFDIGIAKINKPVYTGIAGVVFNVAPKVGIYAKGQFLRQVVSGASNIIGVTGGVQINLMPAE